MLKNPPLPPWLPNEAGLMDCRGVGYRLVRRHVKELLGSSNVDALCLLEIKTAKVDAMVNMAAKLAFSNHFFG